MTPISHQFQSKTRRLAVMAALGVVVWTSGCGGAREDNFDRSQLFTEIASQTDFSAPSDVSGRQGQASYNGTATADFGGFSGTADATLNADFDTKTISGSMTSWEDLDSLNYVLRGQVQLSNGSISNDGSFTSTMTGNIERNQLDRNPFEENSLREKDPIVSPVLKVFGGSAGGQIYDSVGGAKASHVNGVFTGTDQNGGTVNGGFIAKQ